MAPAAIDVVNYLDYRAFLRDYYVEKKARGRGFSHRAFSRKAGLRSPNYLKLVMDGERNLTSSMAERFAKALDLEGEFAEYFLDLVNFNQAKTASARNKHYDQLSNSRRFKKAHRLDLAHAAYHSSWYMPALRELAGRADFRDDPSWIAKTLCPSISKAEAQRALNTLIELKLLVREKDGSISRGEAQLATETETRSLHIANYHRSMMERAAESIDLFPAHDRDVSSLTLCVGIEGIRRYKERIQRFRKELLDLESLEDEPSQVIQINFQLFPLTITEPNDGDEQ